MPARIVAVPSAVTVKPSFRITINLSPMWNVLARNFAGVAEEVLDREMLDFARAIGQEMLYQIRQYALPLSYTGRLADTRTGMTWRLWIGKLRDTRYVTVGLHRPATVPEYIGRPVTAYASGMEWGTSAHTRPWGKMARLRMEAWAEAKLGDRRRARFVMAAIFKHGTRAHPYFVPAARATVRAAEDWAEIYGLSWRDGVEAELRHRF